MVERAEGEVIISDQWINLLKEYDLHTYYYKMINLVDNGDDLTALQIFGDKAVYNSILEAKLSEFKVNN